MRSLASAALLLFATSLSAHAGSSQFSNPYEPYNRRAALAASDQSAPQHASYTKRPDGIDALADRIGVHPKGLDLYQYTDGRGTTAESRFTVGLGGKGLQIQLIW
jgi:hypothetical protein